MRCAAVAAAEVKTGTGSSPIPLRRSTPPPGSSRTPTPTPRASVVVRSGRSPLLRCWPWSAMDAVRCRCGRRGQDRHRVVTDAATEANPGTDTDTKVITSTDTDTETDADTDAYTTGLVVVRSGRSPLLRVLAVAGYGCGVLLLPPPRSRPSPIPPPRSSRTLMPTPIWRAPLSSGLAGVCCWGCWSWWVADVVCRCCCRRGQVRRRVVTDTATEANTPPRPSQPLTPTPRPRAPVTVRSGRAPMLTAALMTVPGVRFSPPRCRPRARSLSDDRCR